MERTLSLNAVPKKYDEAFKRQAVEMVVRGGKRVREVAEDLGVSQYSIYQQRQIADLTQQREILSLVLSTVESRFC
jgi:transposase-like protein